MPHCTKCGAEIAANAQFCQTCGQPQAAASVSPPPTWQPAPTAAGSGLSENAAATLSYVLGWITGIVFFLIDKRPYVRFHAAQSIVTFGGLHIVKIVLGMIFGFGIAFGGLGYGHLGYGSLGGFGIGIALLSLVGLLSFVLWIVCMIKAATGSRFVLPITGPIAENLAGH
jgi:uncharacterized membrane protein